MPGCPKRSCCISLLDNAIPNTCIVFRTLNTMLWTGWTQLITSFHSVARAVSDHHGQVEPFSLGFWGLSSRLAESCAFGPRLVLTM